MSEAGDTVTEASAKGAVRVLDPGCTLGATFESLDLLAAAGAIDGTRNDWRTLTSNETDKENAPVGLIGNDTLNGAVGTTASTVARALTR